MGKSEEHRGRRLSTMGFVGTKRVVGGRGPIKTSVRYVVVVDPDGYEGL